MPPLRMDIVSVFHSEKAYRDHLELTSQIAQYEAKGGWRMVGVDNRVNNRGFANRKTTFLGNTVICQHQGD